jgi:hypothetical protein
MIKIPVFSDGSILGVFDSVRLPIILITYAWGVDQGQHLAGCVLYHLYYSA